MSLSLAAHVTATPTDHGLVLLDQRVGRYYQINVTGAIVLRCLLDGGTIDTAIAALRRRCVDLPDQAIDEVTALVDALSAARLVVPCPGA